MTTSPLLFYVNGRRVTIDHPDPTTLLVDWLRNDAIGLTGTKLSCGEGGCGACTVMLSRWDAARQRVEDTAVNACLRPLASLDGATITTTEGIGSTRETLESVYRTAYAAYEELVEAGVAREVARCVLPVGAYTEFFWTVNDRALMNFVSLRNSEFAQLEIRRYGEAVEAFLAEKMPVTYAAFVANGRIAP